MNRLSPQDTPSGASAESGAGAESGASAELAQLTRGYQRWVSAHQAQISAWIEA